MSLANTFAELVEAIESYGRALTIPAQIRAVIDRHDMLTIDRSDGYTTEIDIGVRRGTETIICHFFVYPPRDGKPAQVAYDMDWHGAPSAPGCAEVETRSWSWDVEGAEPVHDDEPTFFSILQ